jgi:DNA-binding transcriptional ArsR family regulator
MPQTKKQDGTKKDGGKQSPQRNKTIEEVLGYAWNHKIRVQVLSLLNERTYTPGQIAAIIGESLSKVSHHIRELAEGGSIELAKVGKARNADQHHYRAVEMPFYSDEEVWAMTPEQRQMSAGFVIQNMIAETMAAFWAGTIRDDPRTWLAWRWFNVDEEGRAAIADEQQRHWDRIRDIEAEAVGRCAESREEPKSIIVANMGFERERTAPVPPATGASDAG